MRNKKGVGVLPFTILGGTLLLAVYIILPCIDAKD